MLRFKQFLLESPNQSSQPDYSSDDYYNELEERFAAFKAGQNIDLSPMDALSLQFGKQNQKERDEYLQKLREFRKNNPSATKEAEKYANLYDPDSAIFYKKIPVKIASKKEIEDAKNEAGMEPGAWYTGGYITKNPDGTKSIDMNKGNISANPVVYYNPEELTTDEEIRRTLGHEFIHARQLPQEISNTLNVSLGTKQDIDSLSLIPPALLTPSKKEYLPTEYALLHEPNSYFYNRSEVPAYMHELKMKVLKDSGIFPKADQTDEEIEDLRKKIENDINNKVYKSREEGEQDILDNLGMIKMLELLKTPEGKNIWRSVQKTPASGRSDNTRMT